MRPIDPASSRHAADGIEPQPDAAFPRRRAIVSKLATTKMLSVFAVRKRNPPPSGRPPEAGARRAVIGNRSGPRNRPLPCLQAMSPRVDRPQAHF